ncbi:MAG TPA: hypothetical protein VFP34_18280 [Microlunatus sp.]|nr:hypothetical protein [Microlunatus sp.]
MSIYSDYGHQVLHHQSERELIRDAEQRRLLREVSDRAPRRPWWRRLWGAGAGLGVGSTAGSETGAAGDRRLRGIALHRRLAH